MTPSVNAWPDLIILDSLCICFITHIWMAVINWVWVQALIPVSPDFEWGYVIRVG